MAPPSRPCAHHVTLLLLFFTYDMLYIYIYICVCVCVCKRERNREREREREKKKERERERERERESEREYAMCSYNQTMPHGAHVAATVAPLVFCYLRTKIKNRNTKKFFPFWFCIVETNITD